MKVILFIIMAVIIATQTGCMAPTSLQSGRTIGKGKSVLTFGATQGVFQPIPSTSDEDSSDGFPQFIEVGRIYGITNKTEINFKFNSAGFLSVQAKGQFIGDQKSLFASSMGIEAGVQPIDLFNGNSDYYITLPLYASVHPVDFLGIYITPRFIIAKQQETIAIAGLSYGLVFGSSTKFYAEASHFFKKTTTPTQYSLGISLPME